MLLSSYLIADPRHSLGRPHQTEALNQDDTVVSQGKQSAHRWLKEVAAVERRRQALGPPTAGRRRRALCDRVVDMLLHLR